MFKSFLLEGQNEDKAKSLLKKNDKYSDEIFEKFLSITTPYKNDPNGKNNKHLPKLVEFALEGISLDTIKSYYDKFMKNESLSSKPIDQFNFHKFEQLIDSTSSKVKIDTKEIDDKPVYEDSNVKIFLGDNRSKCIEYGQGRKYGFCISRTDQNNLFHGYRKRGATFYFVYFKNKTAQANAPENLIVIHAYPENKYQINYATPNKDISKSKDEIINEFPVLENIFDNVIKYIPFTDKENQIYNKIENVNMISDLKTQDDRLLFIEIGKEILDKEWDTLPNKEELLQKYIEVGLYDVPDRIIDNTKFEDRYYDKIRQRIEIKEDEYKSDQMFSLIEALTQDELYVYIYDNIDKLSQLELKSISQWVLNNYYWKALDILLQEKSDIELNLTDIMDVFRCALNNQVKNCIKTIEILIKHNHYIPLHSLTYAIPHKTLPLEMYEKIIEYTKDDEENKIYNAEMLRRFVLNYIFEDFSTNDLSFEAKKAIDILIKLFEKYDFTRDKKDAYFHVNDVWEKILYSLEKAKEIIQNEGYDTSKIEHLYNQAETIFNNIKKYDDNMKTQMGLKESFKNKIKTILK